MASLTPFDPTPAEGAPGASASASEAPAQNAVTATPAEAPSAAVEAQRPESALDRRPTLENLLDLPTFTEVCRSFVELYRIGLKIFDHRGQRVVDIPAGNADFCGYVFNFARGQRGCSATVDRVKNGPINLTSGARSPHSTEVPKGTVTVPCFTGLRYFVAPLDFEGDHLGRIVYGPYWPEDQKGLPDSLMAVGEGIDRKRAEEYLQPVRHAPEATVARVLSQFSKVLEALIVSGQKQYLTAQVHLEATRESYHALEQKNAELTSANGKLKELDRLKSAFLATVSHELRTPLTSIIGYSEMLTEGMAGALQPDQRDYVKIIMEKGETLLALISSILDLTQIEAGKVRLDFAAADVVDLVKTSISSVLPQFQKKGVRLLAQVAPLPHAPRLDREKVRQCVVNLLSNALKFTPENGQVSVVLEPGSMLGSHEAFVLAVEDTGVGIPRDQRDHVFDSFYQVDNSSTREYGGAGLGLAIVRAYVQAHGGEVRLESEEGKGSAFRMLLPYEPRMPRAPRTPFGDP